MKKPAIPKDEVQRLRKLKSYQILDTLPEEIFDDFTHIASKICEVPISLISLVDADRQWFKSKVGIDVEQTDRSLAFCAHAIHNESVLYVEDAREDERFHDNPLVINDPNVIFYAGAPIVTQEGYKMGTLCVIDDKPRKLNSFQLDALKRLSNHIAENLEFRLSKIELQKVNEELKSFAYRVSHDLKSPLATTKSFLEIIKEDIEAGDLKEAQQNLQKIDKQVDTLETLIQDIFSLVKADIGLQKEEAINLNQILEEIYHRLMITETSTQFQKEILIDNRVTVEKARLIQIIENLISNSIKYSDPNKESSFVKVAITGEGSFLVISVIDNGIGIPLENQKELFQPFKRFAPTHAQGTGLGMTIVKKHIDYLLGTIDFESSDKGTTFTVKIPILS